MTKIYVPDFWPFFKTPNLRRFDYTDPSGSMPPLTSVFAYDRGSDSMLLVDYDAHLNWKDTWYYQNQPGKGVVEWRDDYPGKKVVMNPGIGWGENAVIGGTFQNTPKMDPFRSWPPALTSGVQIVAFEELMPVFFSTKGSWTNVLRFTYLQAWSGKPGSGARYWMAAGVGPVAVQWLAQSPTNPYSSPLIETARMDANVTNTEALVA